MSVENTASVVGCGEVGTSVKLQTRDVKVKRQRPHEESVNMKRVY